MSIKSFIPIAVTFTWIGFVCAISFMEAWLKFKAPGLTLPVGLGIGRLVFSALNLVEWVLVLLLAGHFLFAGTSLIQIGNLFLLTPVVLLVLQTFWLLPALDGRAEMYQLGQVPPPSFLHFYFVAGEAIKVISLFIFGINQFKS